MAGSLPVVHRLRQQGEDGNYILLHVSAAGSRALDLKLIGTENTTVFAASLKHAQTSSLKAKSCPCNQEEWDAILSFVLLGTNPASDQVAAIQGIETVAKVEKNASSVTITIQKRIEGITQRLGTIKLLVSEEAEPDVDLYEWCGQVIETRDASGGRSEELLAKVKDQESQIQMLKDNLEDFIKRKNEHETELLEKFVLILNEKKLKIRDQQRLLASAKVDPEKLAADDASRNHDASRTPEESRPSKRKAGEKPRAAADDSDDGFEKMDVDKEKAALTSDDENAQTTEAGSTTDDASSEEEIKPLPISKARATRTSKLTTNTASSSAFETGVDDIAEAPPPRRTLPFATGGTHKAPVPPTAPPQADGSETESDDEL